MNLQTRFTKAVGIETPIICGSMYPCSNPELVAAVSEAGGIGVVQPLSLIYVYGYDFRKGLRYIRSLTKKPIGMNVLVEKSSRTYEKRLRNWVDIALEEGIQFYETALGNPKWVVQKVAQIKGLVYHKVTDKKYAGKALDAGVNGLIAINDGAGGHAGYKSREILYDELYRFDLPLICGGGIGNEQDFISALKAGYDGVLMGTRFIATQECAAQDAYKEAIIKANASDIVLTERVTGIPLAVIKTPFVEKMGTKAGPFVRWMLRGRYRKRIMRMIYGISYLKELKRSTLAGTSSPKDYYLAGRSVETIDKIESVMSVIKRFNVAAGSISN